MSWPWSAFGDLPETVLILFSWHPLSFVIPISALSYVVGALGAKYLLKEEVNAARWVGVLLVCQCVRFAPVRWFGELAEAGANDLITELPEDATACFSGLLNASDQETAAGARV